MKPVRRAKPAWPHLLLVAALLVLAAYVLLAAPPTVPAAPTPALAATTARPTASPTATRTVGPTATPAAGGLRIATPAANDRLPTIRLDRLPKEAHDTLRLIAAGGPFPYRQDGSIFQNREGRLPRQPADYYREYTVVTPGSPDRGARRLVRGDRGELYYTADHYVSFQRVIP